MVTDNKRYTQNTNQNFQKTKMKTVRIKNKHNMQSVKLYEAESIEEKVRRIVKENEPIEDGAPIIFQEGIDGVKPEFNIRTDRWEVAIEAMDKVSADELSKDNGRNRHRKDERETVSYTNHGLHITNQHQSRTNGTSMETRENRRRKLRAK